MPTTPSAPQPRRRRLWLWLLVLLPVIGAGGYGWQWWRSHQASDLAQASDLDTRLDSLNQRITHLRGDQGAQAARLQQAVATNRILRDELLGLGERSALIEESFARYTDPARHGAQALRLDEAELLLSLAQQRLLIAGDLDGSRRGYALAAGVLNGVDDPAYLSLRQTLGQERAALDAMGGEPRTLALARLDAWAQTIDAQQLSAPSAEPASPVWWKRAFIGIVEVRQLDHAPSLDPDLRADIETGLQLEITLARAAAERRDPDAYRAALHRADAWLAKLATTDATTADRAQLREIADLPLSLTLPTLGTTLIQLRLLRAARRETVE